MLRQPKSPALMGQRNRGGGVLVLNGGGGRWGFCHEKASCWRDVTKDTELTTTRQRVPLAIGNTDKCTTAVSFPTDQLLRREQAEIILSAWAGKTALAWPLHTHL